MIPQWKRPFICRHHGRVFVVIIGGRVEIGLQHHSVRAAFVVARRRVVVAAVGGRVARGAQRRLERGRFLGVAQDAE